MYGIKRKTIIISFFSIFLLMGKLHAEQVVAESETEWETEKILVLNLMHQEEQRLTSLSSTAINDTRPLNLTHDFSDNLTLHAMYGVGQNVLAEVNFKGKTYLYLRGQVWPIGDETGQSQLRLLSMSNQCVLLAHKEQQHNLCVIPTGAHP